MSTGPFYIVDSYMGEVLAGPFDTREDAIEAGARDPEMGRMSGLEVRGEDDE
jgi:hypothetical protein